MLGKLIMVKELVRYTVWTRTHIPRSDFNVHSSITGIPFLHMYR